MKRITIGKMMDFVHDLSNFGISFLKLIVLDEFPTDFGNFGY